MQRSGGKRLLLLVDDAQWLDDASALLFQQLVAARTVFAVATVRTGEPVPDAVQAVWKNGLCDRVDVGPLDRAEVEDLLEQVLGDPVEGAALQQLWEVTEGNLQYLRELVWPGSTRGRWSTTPACGGPSGRITPSERLHDLVGERLAGLDDGEVATLELIAFGEPLGVDVVAGLVGSDPLVRLERKGLVETALDGRRFEATLAHPVHGEVVRDRTPLVRAREVQRLLADAIESHQNRRRADVLKVALWRVEAGGATSPELLIDAARQAGFAHDIETALRLARAAHDLEPTFASGQIIADSPLHPGPVRRDREGPGRPGGRGRRRQPAGHVDPGAGLQPLLARRGPGCRARGHRARPRGHHRPRPPGRARGPAGGAGGHLGQAPGGRGPRPRPCSTPATTGPSSRPRWPAPSGCRSWAGPTRPRSPSTAGLRAYSRLGGQLTLYEPSLLYVAAGAGPGFGRAAGRRRAHGHRRATSRRSSPTTRPAGPSSP